MSVPSATRLKEATIKLNPSAKVQQLNVTDDFSKLRTPCRVLIAGPTNVGKSHLMYKLVKYRQIVFDCQFDKIIYCSPEESLNGREKTGDRLQVAIWRRKFKIFAEKAAEISNTYARRRRRKFRICAENAAVTLSFLFNA